MTDLSDINDSARARGMAFPFGRRGMILVAMAAIGAGAWLNWGWLAAIGAAPLLLAVAPCAVMCGLGLCMKGGSKSCADKSALVATPDTSRD